MQSVDKSLFTVTKVGALRRAFCALPTTYALTVPPAGSCTVTRCALPTTSVQSRCAHCVAYVHIMRQAFQRDLSSLALHDYEA